MIRRVFAGIVCLLLASGSTAGEYRAPGMRVVDEYYSLSALKKTLVGHAVTFENGARAHYLDNGDFLFEPGGGGEQMRGRYVLSIEGLACVKFEVGGSRCDRYVHAMNASFLLTSTGQRWSVETIERIGD